jgi:hypothetical protein
MRLAASRLLAAGIAIALSPAAAADDVPQDPGAFAGRYQAVGSPEYACSLEIEDGGGYWLRCPGRVPVTGDASRWLGLTPVLVERDLYLVGDEERDAFCWRVRKGKAPVRTDYRDRLFVSRGWKGDRATLTPSAYCARDRRPRLPSEWR